MTTINDIVIEQHLGLIGHMLQRYRSRFTVSFGREDAFQEGIFGLMRAAELFDHDRGTRFSTYATDWVRHYIVRAIDDKSRTVRVPIYLQDQRTRRGEPRHASVKSLDELACKHSAHTMTTKLDRLSYPEPDREVLGSDETDLVRAAVAALPEREREIIRRRFGARENTLEEIGQDLGVSRERIRQLEAIALKKIRGEIAHAYAS